MEGGNQKAVNVKAFQGKSSIPNRELKSIEELYPGWVPKNTLGNISATTARSLWSNMGNAERETIKELSLKLENEGGMKIQDVTSIVTDVVGSVCGRSVVAETLSVINRSETGAALLLAKELLAIYRGPLTESCAETDLYIAGEHVFQVQTDPRIETATDCSYDTADQCLPTHQAATSTAPQPESLVNANTIAQDIRSRSVSSTNLKSSQPCQRPGYISKVPSKTSDISTTPLAKSPKARYNFSLLKNDRQSLLGFKEERMERRKNIISYRHHLKVESDKRVITPEAEPSVKVPAESLARTASSSVLNRNRVINSDPVVLPGLRKTDSKLYTSVSGALRKNCSPNMKMKKIKSNEKVSRELPQNAEQRNAKQITATKNLSNYHPSPQYSIQKSEQKLPGNENNPGKDYKAVGKTQRKLSGSQKKLSKINQNTERYSKNNTSNKCLGMRSSSQQLRSKLSRKRIMLTKKAAELGIPLDSIAKGKYVNERSKLAVLEKLVLGKMKIKTASGASSGKNNCLTTLVKHRNTSSIEPEITSKEETKASKQFELGSANDIVKSSLSSEQNVVLSNGNKFSNEKRIVNNDAHNSDCQPEPSRGNNSLAQACFARSNGGINSCDSITSKSDSDKSLSKKSSQSHSNTIYTLKKAVKKASNDVVVSNFLKKIAQQQGFSTVSKSSKLESISCNGRRGEEIKRETSQTSFGAHFGESGGSVVSKITGGVEEGSPGKQSDILQLDGCVDLMHDCKEHSGISKTVGSLEKERDGIESDLIDDAVKTIEEKLRLSKMKYSEFNKHSSLRKSWTEYNPGQGEVDAVEEDRCGDDSRSKESLEVHPSSSQLSNEKNDNFSRNKSDILDNIPQTNGLINPKTISTLEKIPTSNFEKCFSIKARTLKVCDVDLGEDESVKSLEEPQSNECVGDSPNVRQDFDNDVSESDTSIGSTKDSSIDDYEYKTDLIPNNSPSRYSFPFFSMGRRGFTFICLAAGLLSATLLDALAY